MEFVIGAVIIIAAVAIAIWAATSHQGGAGAAPDASASATSPSRRDADGKVVSRTSSRDGDTGIATTVVTLKDGTTTVTRTMPDDSSTSTTTAGGLGAGSLQELAASVQAEYLSRLGSYTLGPGAHEDSRREMFDGQWRDKLDRAANNYNVYLPSGFRQFDFCVNRAIDDYMRVGRPYGTPSAYTYRYSERTTSSFNPTPAHSCSTCARSARPYRNGMRTWPPCARPWHRPANAMSRSATTATTTSYWWTGRSATRRGTSSTARSPNAHGPDDAYHRAVLPGQAERPVAQRGRDAGHG
ncbi:hypothetical protein BBJK_02706 [Bifidobacterium bifidum LMG 13195]|uniref:Uncharacterized protein n=1 Tax=Bifidobacterium bifidum LMG 13195 TaxID=1207542 RepID=A0A286TFS2_BIFBI|nr:hypothetical protein BBJK_02706 [Bifidobacterium bifidum LMG 13195]